MGNVDTLVGIDELAKEVVHVAAGGHLRQRVGVAGSKIGDDDGPPAGRAERGQRPKVRQIRDLAYGGKQSVRRRQHLEHGPLKLRQNAARKHHVERTGKSRDQLFARRGGVAKDLFG